MGFLPGFRFRPTDEEILEYYLPRWWTGQALHPSLAHLIKVDKLYGSKDPDKIYADLGIPEDHRGELYFFTKVKKKHCSSGNDNNYIERVAGNGSWTSQRSVDVFDSNTNQIIGYKNTLNFQDKKRSLNSTWIMHEYTLPNSEDQDEFWGFCSIKRATNGSKDKEDNLSLLRNKNKRPLLESIREADVLCVKKRRASYGLSTGTTSKRPLVESTHEADVLCVKKRRWTPTASYEKMNGATTSYALPVGTTSKMQQGDNGDQTEPPHQPPSSRCTQTIDKGTLCGSSMSPPTLSPGASCGIKDKGKRPLVEGTAETYICNKIHGLTLTDGASTSYARPQL